MTKDQSGFSLIELLVALSILTVVMSIAPMLLGRAGSAAEDRVLANNIRFGLQKARSSAVRRNKAQYVIFDTRARRFDFGEASQAIMLPDEVSATVLAARTLDQKLSMTIAFFPDGSSSGGTIALVSPRGKNVIGVDWLSGRVEFRN